MLFTTLCDTLITAVFVLITVIIKLLFVTKTRFATLPLQIVKRHLRDLFRIIFLRKERLRCQNSRHLQKNLTVHI